MYGFLVLILQPFVLLSLLLALGLVRLWFKCADARRLLVVVIAVFLALTLSSTPAASHLFVRSLEGMYPPSLTRAGERTADERLAIVVLSCWVHPADDVRPRPELGPDSLYRCLRAAELYKKRPSPLLVSGGLVRTAGGEVILAEAMRDFLVRQGVDSRDIILEDRSTTTYENAVESARLLRQRDINHIILVVDAIDMPRADWCFQALGFDVTPSGTNYRATRFDWSLEAFLPSPDAAVNTRRAAHEWLGIVWYWLRGRFAASKHAPRAPADLMTNDEIRNDGSFVILFSGQAGTAGAASPWEHSCRRTST